MPKFLILFFILSFNNFALASIKQKIILKLEQTNNLSFKFKQQIGEKNEDGNCIIKYPKKIYCEYNDLNKKIIVSNGKSLVIKNKKSGTFYLYSLKKTPLNFLLDKNYIIKKISSLNYRDLDNKYLNFTLLENNNEINIFFDKKTLNLIGWQIEDIYQNLTITFISSVKINKKIDDKIFILPKRD
jgi:outer membrane lipoprotein-sorting protein